MPQAELTGVILAGGRSRRMGRPKPLIPIDGVPMIAVVARRLRRCCREIVVVTNDPALAEPAQPCVVVADEHPNEGPLGGFADGLAAVSTELCVLVGCDMPFLDPDLIQELAGRLGDNDAAVPVDDSGVPQPLHGVYRRGCLERVRQTYARGERRLQAFLDTVDALRVERDVWGPIDPEGLSWASCDTPEDLKRAGFSSKS